MWLEQNGNLQYSRSLGQQRLFQCLHPLLLLSHLLVLRLGLAEVCLVWSPSLRSFNRVRHTWRERLLPPTRHSPLRPQSSALAPSGSHGWSSLWSNAAPRRRQGHRSHQHVHKPHTLPAAECLPPLERGPDAFFAVAGTPSCLVVSSAPSERLLCDGTKPMLRTWWGGKPHTALFASQSQ